ncbi:hypothetical protein [Fluviicola taffensis]|uniref:hypothetical protein n=1 Tax=Fluviicola taffensis TaxID=191579 RepID=UPI0031382608
MKLILLLLLFLPTLSFAWIGQNSEASVLSYLRWGAKYELGYDYRQNLYYGATPETMKQNKVRVVKSFAVNKYGKKKGWYERTFDLSGRLIQMKSDGNTVNYKFTDTLLSEIQRITKKHTFNTKIGYDSQSRIVIIQSFKDEQLNAETRYVYFNGDLASLVEKKIYGKKEKTYRLETDYDDLLKKATESRYVINGELKKRWVYSCDEKGKIQESKLDEVKQCQYYGSNNDGSYISYTRTIEDGKDYLQEIAFNKDSVMTGYKRFLHDSILVNHNTYSKEKDVFEAYKKNGKRSYKLIQEKDKNGNIIRHIDCYKSTDKTIITTTLLYSNSNLIQEVTYQSGRKVQFEYTYL